MQTNRLRLDPELSSQLQRARDTLMVYRRISSTEQGTRAGYPTLKPFMFQGSSSLGYPAEHHNCSSLEAQIISILPPGGFLLVENIFSGKQLDSCLLLWLCSVSLLGFFRYLWFNFAQSSRLFIFLRGAGLNSIGHYFHKYLSFVSIEVT